MSATPQTTQAAAEPLIYIYGEDEDPYFLEALRRMMQSARWPVKLRTGAPNTPFSALVADSEEADFILLPLSQPTLNDFKVLRFLPSWIAYKAPEQVLLLLRPPLEASHLPHELQAYLALDFTSEDRYSASTTQLLQVLHERFSRLPPRSLQLRNEKGSTQHRGYATPALLRLLALSARINQQRNEQVDVSFGAVLHACTLADDTLSQWFTDYVRQTGVAGNMGRLLRGPGIDTAMLERVAQAPLLRDELAKPLLPSVSTSRLLDEASNVLLSVSTRAARGSSVPPLDVRHLMAAYIYRSQYHEQDLKEAGFNLAEWSSAFVNRMAWLHPEELSGWKKLHQEVFPSHSLVLEAEGPSTHIATDQWTVEDTLGYDTYAYAVYRFMTHTQTRAPLTVSIQAPWGGGKTSLMRMIQREMDPTAFWNQAPSGQRTPLTLRDVMKEIQRSLSAREPRQLPRQQKAGSTGNPRRMTVWFNAWKYESTNQLWAGLVDAVTQQVASRLPPREQERFWLQLNLNRVDVNVLRQKIRGQLFEQFWSGMRKGLLGVGGLLLAWIAAWATGGLETLGWAAKAGPWGLALSAIGGVATLLSNTLLTAWKSKTEPAAASLGQYLSVPDYSKELGFIHHAELDLRRVLDSIPEENKPVVIFIDDLDRCSPQNVAKVVEAVNLFLAGDIPDCMFVLGMDTEMVAAALQSAHKGMLDSLPLDTGTPLGWRFMDKFVQLPFVIPPPESQGVQRLTSSLFKQDVPRAPIPEVETLARATAGRAASQTAFEQEFQRVLNAQGYDASQQVQLQEPLRTMYARQKLDEGIARFTDRSEEMRQVIATAIPYFQGNPRELKRFVNAFRFHYFVWYAHRARGLRTPSMSQLVRWTVLSMKWPALARWLRRGSESPASAAEPAAGEPQVSTTVALLRCLESSAKPEASMTSWREKVCSELPRLPPTTPWLHDDTLFHFFQAEGLQPEAERLSRGSGLGLW